MDIVEHLRNEHGIPMRGDVGESPAGAFHLGLHLPLVGKDPDHEHDYEELIDRLPELAGLKELLRERETIAELIERSSLGTPEAKAIRAQTPPHVTEEILRRVEDGHVDN